jgi:hypothetical protein
MLFGEKIAVYCENHTEHTNIHCVGRMQSFGVSKRVKHTVWPLGFKGLKYLIQDLYRLLKLRQNNWFNKSIIEEIF